jgi:hypothetical protein
MYVFALESLTASFPVMILSVMTSVTLETTKEGVNPVVGSHRYVGRKTFTRRS